MSDTNYAVIYDLHSHTTASDGCLTPEALVHRAVDDKLSNMRILEIPGDPSTCRHASFMLVNRFVKKFLK